MSNDNSRMGWDDTIENDGAGEFVVLPAGDYDFQVVNMERTVSNASGANMAVLTLKIGNAQVFDHLVLLRSCEWKLASFFVSIGMRKHGERYRPQWNRVVGARGRCRLEVAEYTSKNGEKRQKNQVKAYLDPIENAASAEATDEDFAF